MNTPYYVYPYPNVYYTNVPMCTCWNFPNRASYEKQPQANVDTRAYTDPIVKDHGKEPFIVNMEQAAEQNNTYRTAIWTGKHLQVTLMSINVRDNIGLEIHPNVDQFLRIEEGQGFVQMGKDKDNLDVARYVNDDSAIMVPAGTWHDVTNTGNVPLKLYSIYGPPSHPFGTVHRTKTDAMIAEEGYRNRNGNTPASKETHRQ